MAIWPPDRENLTRPVYHSLAQCLVRALEAGEIKSGTKLPTHRALAFELEISIQTVSRAYEELARLGLITAVVFILVAAGAAFSWVISFAQIPQAILGSIGIDEMGQYGVLFVISIAFFIGCMFVDPIVVILVLVPIFAPVVKDVGLDPVLVGTVITLQVAIGSATPPFGCDIFTAIAVFKRPYIEVIRGTPPFIIMLLSVSVALIYFPQIALFLRDLAFAK
jgi:C4-dicarboxylate transporter DctM subunit